MKPPWLLALNLGSSNIKASAYDFAGSTARLVEGTANMAQATVERSDDATADLAGLLQQIQQRPGLAYAPTVVAHRIVHGGLLERPALLDDSMLEWLARYNCMAPLHQPAALQLVDTTRVRWPDARQVAAFDTSWHSGLARWSRRLPVEQSVHDAGGMRYGFHGLAFQSVMRELQRAAPALSDRRLVLAHLGGGSSLCAVADGRSVDTTMGMTPLDGLPMATRPGALDPGVPIFMLEQMHMSATQVSDSLAMRSGMLGISGRSGDMRTLLSHPDDPSCRDAIDCYVMRAAQGIASMATALGGIDALVYSGGIGYGSSEIRMRIAEHLGWLGLELDPSRNDRNEPRIHAPGSGIECWRLEADEQLELLHAARDCVSDRSWAP